MRAFGTQADGTPVLAGTIRSGRLAATVLTRGAILQDVRIEGVDRSLTVGTADLRLYEATMAYHGALIAPVANRLRAPVLPLRDGVTLRLDAPRWPLLHSGAAGAQLKAWEVVEEAEARIALAVRLPHGEGGFPGARRLVATYEVVAPATLRLTVTAETDRPTAMNVAHHGYWNLDGTPTWEGHRLQVMADRYLPVDESLIPTGVAPVAGTPFDLREGRALKPREPLLDHSFCLADARGPLREALRLTGASGVGMSLWTTEPGLQVYDGNQGPARPGARAFEAFAVEAQMWPDAPGRPGWPPILLRPHEPWRQVTEWRFTG